MSIDTPNFDYDTGFDKIGSREMLLVSVLLTHLNNEHLPNEDGWDEFVEHIKKSDDIASDSKEFQKAAFAFRFWYLDCLNNIDLPSLSKRIGAMVAGFKIVGHRPWYSGREGILRENLFKELGCSSKEELSSVSDLKFQMNEVAKKMGATYMAFTRYYFYGH